ncbi:zinc finger protein 239-like isoform X2 [Ixodes scapularis]|uniref:zinc finger protein 239-like isoform X2 n=1 Tax=Ixodes scapularis TaxID=6945 RepID=UPI001A9FCEF7|nr:zinc finger protein 239-like isoform X2 [Ixodes scapularis]
MTRNVAELTGTALKSFDSEWQRTDCEDKGAELSFQGAELQRQPLKMDQEGRTDGGATSPPNLMVPTELTTPELAHTAFDSEWQRTDCEDKGAELSFQGADLQRPPLKMDQEGRTDGGATSDPNLVVSTELTTPDCIGACYGDKVDTFDRNCRRGDTSPQTNNSGPHKQQTHRRPKKHPCRFCPYSCLSAAAVAIHERTHTGERPFSCDACEKTFTQKPHLISHVKIHTGEKPFRCNTCSRAFSRKCILANHERIHTGEKPFRCNTCSRAFTRKYKLANHERTHTGEKPFKCETCGRAFAADTYLHSHRKIHRK